MREGKRRKKEDSPQLQTQSPSRLTRRCAECISVKGCQFCQRPGLVGSQSVSFDHAPAFVSVNTSEGRLSKIEVHLLLGVIFPICEDFSLFLKCYSFQMAWLGRFLISVSSFPKPKQLWWRHHLTMK